MSRHHGSQHTGGGRARGAWQARERGRKGRGREKEGREGWKDDAGKRGKEDYIDKDAYIKENFPSNYLIKLNRNDPRRRRRRR